MAETPAPRAHSWRIVPVIFAVGVLALATARLLSEPPPAPPPPSYFELPDFTLTSHEERPFSRADLSGRVWVVGFFFTRCPTICPVLTQRMQAVQALGAPLGERFRLASITVDPEHDSPEVMRAFAAAQGVTLDSWTMLTGSTEDIQRIVREGFKEHLVTAPDMPAEDVVHSVRFFLVDGGGSVRGLYDGTDPEAAEALIRDARAVLAEAPN